MKLKILHTNDIHSNFENFSKIATLIAQHKDDNTLILDVGISLTLKASNCKVREE